jgi:hypothetical protein
LASSMSIAPKYGHRAIGVLAYTGGVVVLCLTFVVTHAELHGNTYPVLTAGMALWAISPLLLVNLARGVKGFAGASIGRFFILHLTILFLLLLPQFSLSFRDQQFVFKQTLGVYSDLYPVLVAISYSVIAILLSTVVHSSTTWRVRILYALTTGFTVLSLFLINI